MAVMGEFELLARLRSRLPSPSARVVLGSGDDAAITIPGGATAISVDASIDGVHFRRGQLSLAAIGRRALAVALSDLAAMGALAGEAYTWLGLPRDLLEDDALEILDGMSRLASELGVTLAGGDLTRAPALALAVTVVGHAGSAAELIPRSGACCWRSARSSGKRWPRAPPSGCAGGSSTPHRGWPRGAPWRNPGRGR